MEFPVKGHQSYLRGDPSLTCRACVCHELKSLAASDECWLFWAIESGAEVDQFRVSESLSVAAREELSAVLSPFPMVNAPTTPLPPK